MDDDPDQIQSLSSGPQFSPTLLLMSHEQPDSIKDGTQLTEIRLPCGTIRVRSLQNSLPSDGDSTFSICSVLVPFLAEGRSSDVALRFCPLPNVESALML